MDTRIQFRVDEEVKKLAQQMAESQGHTLSDACRELVESLADKQRQSMSHDVWLTEQVNKAFDKYEKGDSVFLPDDKAHESMEERKNRVREKFNK